jgi:hypothetical protein
VTLLHVDDDQLSNNVNGHTVTVCADNDNDEVANDCLGIQDNCPDVANTDQIDTDSDGLGDACEEDPFHDVGIMSMSVFGPAPVNISDTVGAFTWIIAELANLSDQHELVRITFTGTQMPAGCEASEFRAVPAQPTFILAESEAKFLLYRLRYLCHAPAVDGTLAVTLALDVEHINTGDGQEASGALANNHFEDTRTVIISSVTPPP